MHFLISKFASNDFESTIAIISAISSKVLFSLIRTETKKTYSLLPHFITRYQRHINTVIEDILQKYFAEGTSAENLAEVPSPWTIRRWIYTFSKMIVSAEDRVEKFLIGNIPSYRVATQNSETMLNKLSEIKRKADLITLLNKIHLN